MRTKIFTLLLTLTAVSHLNAAVTYSSGMHVISSNLNDVLTVEGTAEVYFTNGASAFSVDVRDHAFFSMSGGGIGTSLRAFGGHTYVTGGSFNTAGVLTAGIFAWNYAYVRFEGASVSVISVSTDLLNSQPGQNPVVDIYGGIIASGLSTQGNGTVNVFGGTLNVADHGLESDGLINLYGGAFNAGTTISGGTWNGGTVNIFGGNFNYPIGTIPDKSGSVSGILDDGSSFSFNFLGEDMSVGRRAATINLKAIPEPATGVLGALSLSFMFGISRRRNG
ncbi:MAG: hypothetical protein ABIT37_21625 [Luteolibacter sp.]